MGDVSIKRGNIGDLSDELLEDMRAAAVYSRVNKVILYGSRARRSHRKHSDVDIAVIGGDVERLRRCLNEDMPSLLMFDVVDLGKPVSASLMEDIERDGIVLFEKA